MIAIGVIEDLDDYRGLLTILLGNTPGMGVMFATGNAEAAVDLMKNGTVPDVCLVDIGLPGLPGIDLVRWVNKCLPRTLSVMCTSYDTDDKVFQSLEAGAHGYILKSTPPSGIVSAIVEVVNGGSPMTSEIARKVVRAFNKKSPLPIPELTPREQEVLEQLAKGLLYKEIAAQLGISIETVKRHCFNVYQKLHVQNRTEAINKLKI